MSRVVTVGVPGTTPTLEDVVQVAKDGGVDWMQASGQHSLRAKSELPAARVAVHKDAVARLEKEFREQETNRVPPGQALEDHLRPSSSGGPSGLVLTSMQTRAVMFVRLLTIVNGKTKVRIEVVRKLEEMLNATHNIRVRVSERDETVLAEIVRLISADEHGEKIQLTPHEQAVLMTGQIPTVGLGAITVVAAKGIQKVALAVCALTCETLQVQTEDISVEKVQHLCSPHAVSVSKRLLELMSGSERINPKQGGAGTVGAISMVPAVHGELDAAIQRCEEAVTVILRNIPSDPVLMLRLGPTIGLPIVLLYMSTLLVRASELSLARTEKLASIVRDHKWIPQELRNVKQFLVHATALRDAAQQVITAEVGKACFAGALAGWAGVTALLNSLAMESSVLLLSLREQEIPIRDAPPSSQDDYLAPRHQRPKSKDPGLSLGFGASRFRLLLEDAVTDFSKIQLVAQQLAALRGGQPITEPQLRIQALLAALDPIGEELPREMAELQHLMKSQARRRSTDLPRGTRDFLPEQVVLRQNLLERIAGVFQRHGAVPLDTPVLQERGSQTVARGDASTSVFDIRDEVTETLSLRYDLTVPLARFIAENNLSSLKSYQIARVYRKEAPEEPSGMFREFYQCDFDIAGNTPRMMAEAEVLKALVEVLRELEMGEFCIRVSHRLLLRGMMRLHNVPRHKHEAVFRSIDRHEVHEEHERSLLKTELYDHGVAVEVAEKIVQFVLKRGEPKQLLEELRSPESNLAGIDSCSSALADLGALFGLLEAVDCLQHVELNLGVIGGLDYYTGVVFEAFPAEPSSTRAVAGGGRYDDLIGSFGEKQVRAVGFSIRFDRIFPVIEQNVKDTGDVIRGTKTQVLIMSVGKDMQQERLKLANELWEMGIGAEFTHSKANPFLPEQFSHATNHDIPLAVIMAPRELSEGNVELMEVRSGTRTFVQRSDIRAEIEKRLEVAGPLSATFPPPPPR